MKKSLVISLLLCSALIFASCTAKEPTSTPVTPEPAVTAPAEQKTETDTPAADAGEDVPAEPQAPEIVRDPITFSMFIVNPDSPPGDNNKIVKMIEEATGVTIEFEYLVGDLEQKLGVMVAGGDYPDMLYVGSGQPRARIMEAGGFAALDDLIPQYPNINKHFEPYMDKLRKVSPDNKIYIMDSWARYYWYGENAPYLPEHNGPAFWTQKDVLAEMGYPNPKTLDEFFDMLAGYYEKFPTIDGQATLPFEILSYDWRSFCLKNAPQHMIGGANDGDVFVDKTTYTAEIYQNKWYAKDYYAKLNEVYKKGLISPETFTQNYDQYLAKVAQGRVLAMFDQQWNFQQGEDALKAEDKWERTYVPLGLTYEGYEQWYREFPGFLGGNGMGISVNCKDIPRAMDYINMLLSEELQTLMSWGIEGEDYYVDENGRYRRTPEQKVNFDNRDWKNENSGDPIRKHFPKIDGQFSNGNAADSGTQPEERVLNQEPYDTEFFSHYGYFLKSDFLTLPGPNPDYYPAYAFTLADGSDAKIAFDTITDTENRYLPGVIMADDFESAWTEYSARYDSINYTAYEQEVNRQIALRMGM